MVQPSPEQGVHPVALWLVTLASVSAALAVGFSWAEEVFGGKVIGWYTQNFSMMLAYLFC